MGGQGLEPAHKRICVWIIPIHDCIILTSDFGALLNITYTHEGILFFPTATIGISHSTSVHVMQRHYHADRHTCRTSCPLLRILRSQLFQHASSNTRARSICSAYLTIHPASKYIPYKPTGAPNNCCRTLTSDAKSPPTAMPCRNNRLGSGGCGISSAMFESTSKAASWKNDNELSVPSK